MKINIKRDTMLLFKKLITSKLGTKTTTRNIYSSRVLDSEFERKTHEDEAGEPAKSNASIKKYNKQVQEIVNYFKGKHFSSYIEELPPRVLKQLKSRPEHLYLLDEDAADKIVNSIEEDISPDPTKIIEVNPGMGLITQRLLEKGIPRVHLMEQNAKFLQPLASLQTKYPDKVVIIEADLFNVWKLAYADKQDGGNRVADLFSDFPHTEWGSEAGLKIIGTVTNISFLRHILMDTVRQCGIVSYGRPCLYLCMPPSIWKRLTSNREQGLREYRGLSVMFQLLFDYEVLEKIPRKSFLPWAPKAAVKKLAYAAKNSEMDQEFMYMVKIIGKKNLFTEVIDGKHIQPLWFFVNHHMFARTSKVIQHMESWQPGCGPSLIMQDFNIFTQFGDLNPQQVLKLFKEFTSWDGYQNSFIPSMENSFQKMEQLIF